MGTEASSLHVALKRLPDSPVVGRGTELSRLTQCFDVVLRGERQLILLSGEPGIGKSTLIDAFLTSLRRNETDNRQEEKEENWQEGVKPQQPESDVRSSLSLPWIGRGQCVEHYGAGEAYLPLLDALSSLGRQGRQEVPLLLKRYAPTWLAQLPILVDPAERDELQRTLVGATRERMLRELAEALEALSARRPLVLVLEDLHWSDPSTVEMLAYVARRRGSARLLILGAYRPTEILAGEHPLRDVVREIQGRAYGTEIRLELLPEAPILTYLTTRFEGLAHDTTTLHELTQALYQRTEGNPLFLVTTVEQLVREGKIVQTVEGWRFEEGAAATVAGAPSEVRLLIEKQIDSIEADSQRLLEVASVVGVEFGVATVAAVMDQAIEAIDARCERLAAWGQFLQATGLEEWPDGTVGGRYRFLHSLYHDVVYERMAEARRVQQHRHIAARKEAVYGARAGEIAAELAMHFAKGWEPQRAIPYLEHAGGKALQRHAHHEAIEHLTKALELLTQQSSAPERMHQELRLLTSLGQALTAVKGYAAPEVEHTYARAWELCQQIGDAPQLFPVLAGFWRFCAVGAKHELARDLGEQLLIRAQGLQEPLFLQEAHRALGATLFWLGETPRARIHMEQSLAFHDPQTESSRGLSHEQDSWLACLAFAAMTLWTLGYPDQALHRIIEALNLARMFSHPFRLAFALHHTTIVYQLLREERIVQETAEELQTLASEQGFPLWRATGAFQHGWALTESGRVEEGIVQLQQGMVSYHKTGAELGRPYQLALLGEAQGKVVRADAGISLLNEALGVVSRSGERCWEGEIYRLKGELTLQKGGRDWGLETRSSSPHVPSYKPLLPSEAEAEAYFLKAIDIARQQQAKSWELRATMSLARLWQSRGKRDEARELLQEVYDWFTEGFATKDLQAASVLLTELGGAVNKLRKKTEASSPLASSVLPFEPSFRLQPVSSSLPDLIPNTQHSTLDTQHSTPDTQLPTSHPHYLFRHDGTYWTVAFEGVVARLDETLGMRYLALLLQCPWQDIHVRELAGEPLASNEEMQPEGASSLSTATRQRMQELREELAEAEAFHDEGRTEQLQVELQALTETLLQKAPKPKKLASSTERARLNVTRAIKTAIKKITVAHPALGVYLTQTITTGTRCAYRPSDSPPISWEG